MEVSEDGTVTGSIDVSKLDEIKPKTDEAKAQLDALKAEVTAGQEQVAGDAEAKAEQEQVAREDDSEVTTTEAVELEAVGNPDELEQLRAEAEAIGVKVDKRWGADRLRSEIDAARTEG
jgi:outer membrane murein-binding lipoprotein Lpp